MKSWMITSNFRHILRNYPLFHDFVLCIRGRDGPDIYLALA